MEAQHYGKAYLATGGMASRLWRNPLSCCRRSSTKLHALLLAEDALGWQPQVVGGQVPERHTSQQSSQIRMSLAMLSCIRDM